MYTIQLGNQACNKLSPDPGLRNGFPYALNLFLCSARYINEDFVVPDTTRLLVGQNPPPFSVLVNVQLDGIALEPAKGFALSLGPINPAAMAILAVTSVSGSVVTIYTSSLWFIYYKYVLESFDCSV